VCMCDLCVREREGGREGGRESLMQALVLSAGVGDVDAAIRAVRRGSKAPAHQPRVRARSCGLERAHKRARNVERTAE
jgi:hypothetical protein